MTAEHTPDTPRFGDWWDGLREGRREQTDTIRASLSERAERAELHWRQVADSDGTNGWLAGWYEGKHEGLFYALTGVEGWHLAQMPDRQQAARREEEGYALGERVQIALDNEQRRDSYEQPPGRRAARIIGDRAVNAQTIADHRRARGRVQRAQARTPRRPPTREGRDDREGVGDRGR